MEPSESKPNKYAQRQCERPAPSDSGRAAEIFTSQYQGFLLRQESASLLFRKPHANRLSSLDTSVSHSRFHYSFRRGQVPLSSLWRRWCACGRPRLWRAGPAFSMGISLNSSSAEEIFCNRPLLRIALVASVVSSSGFLPMKSTTALVFSRSSAMRWAVSNTLNAYRDRDA